MIYVISAVVGAVYGAGAGLLKYIALWRGMLTAGEAERYTNKQVVTRMMIGYVINAVVLLLVLFLRHLIEPLDFATTLIAAAVGLSLAGKAYSLNKIYSKVDL